MKRALSLILFLALFLSTLIGCNTFIEQGQETGESVSSYVTTFPELTTSPKTTLSETTVAETSSPETTLPDTTVAETTTPETTLTETTPAETTSPETTALQTEPPVVIRCSLNGVSINEYTIIYSENALDYNKRAAEYLRDQIEARTGYRLSVKTDKQQSKTLSHEIVVGETNRAISKALDAKTYDLEFSIMANSKHIAMEGDFFVIAAAAYYFVDKYITGEEFTSNVPKKVNIYEPIVKKAKNYIFLIGDGMGINQTQLFDVYSADGIGAYSDGESEFYGYMLPYMGFSRTNSLSGTTDSAAGGTALASGYKTKNGYVGKDGNKNDVKSLTEIAIELGKSTAVMSTEVLTGATPASFSAHADSRDDTSIISACQKALKDTYGTLILGQYGTNYGSGTMKAMENDIRATLAGLSKNKNGFFLMYEEAYVDKHSHSNEMQNTFLAILRFNQAIGVFMEYTFYNPDTFIIITADHETGGLSVNSSGTYYYKSTNHSNANVPVFAYGYGAEVFDDVTVENIQIPKTIAKMWGYDLVGYDNENYPALNNRK